MGSKNASKGYNRRQQDKQLDAARNSVSKMTKGGAFSALAVDLQRVNRERDHYKAAWESEKEIAKAAWDIMKANKKHYKKAATYSYFTGILIGATGVGIAWIIW